MTYDWAAGLVPFAATVVFTKVGRFVAFRHPALRRMRALNAEMDAPKREKKRYQSVLEANARVGLSMNLAFFLPTSTCPTSRSRLSTTITTKHHKHHENLEMGNYATLTMAYDYLSGTLD